MLAPHKLWLSSATFETENIFKSPYSSLYFQDFAEVPNVKKEHFSRMEGFPGGETSGPFSYPGRRPAKRIPGPSFYYFLGPFDALLAPQIVGSYKASPSVRGSGFGFSSRSLLTYTPIRGSVFGDFPRWGGEVPPSENLPWQKETFLPTLSLPARILGGKKDASNLLVDQFSRGKQLPGRPDVGYAPGGVRPIRFFPGCLPFSEKFLHSAEWSWSQFGKRSSD